MWHRLGSVFLTFLRLGLTTFGGPTAHIAAFSREFVDRRGWLSAEAFAHDSSLCQLIPGPASSQLGMLIGARRAGIAGSIAAFLGFTLPSALLLYIAARGQTVFVSIPGLTTGLLCGAAVVVTHAVWILSKPIYTHGAGIAIASTTFVVMLLWPGPITQIIVLWSAAVIAIIVPGFSTAVSANPSITLPRRLGALLLGAFVLLLCVAAFVPSVFSILFQAGALVFGGGHVVLPMLTERMQQSGILPVQTVTEGYAYAQLMPGPLFTLATYIGTVATGGTLWGAVAGTVAIFLPGFLLILGIQPWWAQIAMHPRIGSALAGVHACVVGILAASAYTLLRLHVATTPATLAFGMTAALLLWRSALPAWLIPFVGAIGGWLFFR